MPTPSQEEFDRSLEMAQDYYGLVPEIIKVVNKANPAVAQIYIAAMELMEDGELANDEREAVILAISRYNDCHYCARTHAALGYAAGLSKEDIELINQGRLPVGERLKAVVQATRLILDKSGWLDDEDLSQLEDRGITRMHLYEINALISLKTLSNYINHVAQTKIDEGLDQLFPIMAKINQEGWAEAPDKTNV
ncbi:MAG: carboxymuconolactone decarboxylase family protein [Longimonas sp.]|uniref:carboxymuconolactone decarboxylase family protein n=1 Tax=Longimonas sp. TaxID=2039626 RepID=UPI003976E1F8